MKNHEKARARLYVLAEALAAFAFETLLHGLRFERAFERASDR